MGLVIGLIANVVLLLAGFLWDIGVIWGTMDDDLIGVGRVMYIYQ